MNINKTFVLQYFELRPDGFRDWVDFMEDDDSEIIEVWEKKAPNAQKSWRIVERTEKIIISG